ncbi:MAG: cell envelope integrity protein CreD, partial [Muribaculaceae bacterium]|nr:cell envelope integrity protein CreD [Muribaculaceae bacterium]
SCYVLLSLTNYALLLGSLILFIALAAMMYASLQIKQS